MSLAKLKKEDFLEKVGGKGSIELLIVQNLMRFGQNRFLHKGSELVRIRFDFFDKRIPLGIEFAFVAEIGPSAKAFEDYMQEHVLIEAHKVLDNK